MSLKDRKTNKIEEKEDVRTDFEEVFGKTDEETVPRVEKTKPKKAIKKEKDANKEEFIPKIINTPKSLAKALDKHIADLKDEGFQLWDSVNEKYRKVSLSSYVTHLIQKDLEKNGKY